MTDYMRGQPFGFPDIPHNPVTPRSTSDNSRPPKGLTKSDPTNNQSPDELEEALALINYSIEYADTHGGCPPAVKAVHKRGTAAARKAIEQLKATWERQARIAERNQSTAELLEEYTEVRKQPGLWTDHFMEGYAAALRDSQLNAKERIAELEQPNPELETISPREENK